MTSGELRKLHQALHRRYNALELRTMTAEKRLETVAGCLNCWEQNFGPEPGNSPESRVMLSACRTLRAALKVEL